ncbi:MAG: sulfatase [Spirochaetales bacterium]|jgi:arylsulfatase A-like enzyme|nr:sulfatase [Spirochaetales bacterium]
MKPNIVYVLADQWRGQAFGYTGDPNVKTPCIDELASRCISFKNAVSVSPVCTPHRASLLTGRYPTTTGMFMNDLYLPKEELCMAEIFKESGYDTGYIGKWHLDGHGRHSYIPKERRQGFDYWKVLECTHDYNNSYYYAGDDDTRLTWDGYDAYPQTEDARNYIREHADGEKPFFLFVGYGGPHFPHNNAPEELQALYPSNEIELRPNVSEDMKEKAREELQGYYAHCTAIDRCVGELYQTLEESGAAENTIFIFTSDHGDMFGSQGKRPWRKQVPWDESIRVPFLFRYPALTGESRGVRTPLNTPDILPTLLSLAGIPIPDTIEGEDLSGLISDPASDAGEKAALFMSVAPFGATDFKAYRGIRTSRYTYVRDSDGPWLLYDNQEDPYQMKNLINKSEMADLRAELEEELQSQLNQIGDGFPTGEEALAQWGFTVNVGGEIPYRDEFRTQSPGVDPGKISTFRGNF